MNFGLDIVDGIGGLNFEDNHLARERLDENLHAAKLSLLLHRELILVMRLSLPESIRSMTAGLRTVILLSFVLAVGFLLIILSCALWQNWLPLLVALTFVLAPLPNALFASCGTDDISSYESSAPADLGRFITAMIVVTGFALPIVLAHSEIINPKACGMAIAGGGLVYATILAYSAAFSQESDYD